MVTAPDTLSVPGMTQHHGEAGSVTLSCTVSYLQAKVGERWMGHLVGNDDESKQLNWIAEVWSWLCWAVLEYSC